MGGLIEIAGTEVSPIDVVAVVWFVLAGLSTAYVVWDGFVNKNPEATVMKWGWILITLYKGPLALALYVLTDKEPAPGEHEEFIKPLWKQGIGSTVHCIAGDATGIIAAAVITAALGLPMWVDLIVEYSAGFAFGLFVFQSLFMKDMAGGSYLEAVKNSFMPEWLSMNMMAAGMLVQYGVGDTERLPEISRSTLPRSAAAILRPASSAYSLSDSLPTKKHPNSLAATAVVPDPQKGSNTTSPSPVQANSARLTRRKGFWVGW